MQYITEFEPDQLLIVQDFDDLPDEYRKLLKKFLSKQYGHKGKLVSDSWDWGTHIRILHWEWTYKIDGATEHTLVIDITGYPAGIEHGVICVGGEIVFENENQVLTPLIEKKCALLSRQQAFEYLRKLDENDKSEYVQAMLKIIDELKSDLQEEEVDEEEIKETIENFVHYSSDDATPIDSPIASESSEE